MKALGQKGEELAAIYLQDQGYHIIAKNWRCERGEIDLIARDGTALVFIEVKTRRTNRCGSPVEAVGPRKQERLRLLARHFIHQTKTTAPCYRFDVAAVDAGTAQITVIKDAF